jgi:zinc protease
MSASSRFGALLILVLVIPSLVIPSLVMPGPAPAHAAEPAKPGRPGPSDAPALGAAALALADDEALYRCKKLKPTTQVRCARRVRCAGRARCAVTPRAACPRAPEHSPLDVAGRATLGCLARVGLPGRSACMSRLSQVLRRGPLVVAGLCAGLLAIGLDPPAAARRVGSGEANVRPPDLDPRIAYTHFVLQNGLRVFVIEDHTTPQIAIVTYYRVGSKDEVPGKTGFAHLFEHMMFKGSAHTPDGMIDVLFEEAGGSTNAFTTADQTVYHDTAASSFLEPALWLEADRIAGLTDTLDQKKLDNQRDVVRNEFRQGLENQPYGLEEIWLAEALWPKGHGYSWSTIGSHADLKAATTDDVIAFFRNYYVPQNATMVIAGDVDPAKTKALVEKYLGWIPRGAEPKRPVYKTPPPITKEIRLVKTDDVQATKVSFVWRGPVRYGEGEAALSLVADVLAGSKQSRLYQRLVARERLAQRVEASMQGAELGGTFSIEVIVKPGESAERVITIVNEELALLAKTPPSADELADAQSAREAAFLRRLESPMARAQILSFYDVVAKDPDFLAKDLARYRAVTPAALRAAAAQWLSPNARVLLTTNPQNGGAK